MKYMLSILLALATLGSGAVAAQETPAEGRGYLVGPGDVLTIKVMDESQFSIDAVTVDEDGKIEVPFSKNPVVAQCRTEKELRAEVTKLLAVYLKNPQATVYVKERNSRPPATVYGEIRNPQRVQLTRRATLQDLLAFAGGVTEKAGGIIQVTRTQPVLCEEATDANWNATATTQTNGAVFPSRIYSVGSLRDVNPQIYPGDIIQVLEAPRVYVVGEVRTSGEMRIPEGGLPLTQALAMASGITRDAKKKDIRIYRRKQGVPQPEMISINLDEVKSGKQKDLMLEPYDIVEVGKAPESIWSVMRDVATGGARNLANLPVFLL